MDGVHPVTWISLTGVIGLGLFATVKEFIASRERIRLAEDKSALEVRMAEDKTKNDAEKAGLRMELATIRKDVEHCTDSHQTAMDKLGECEEKHAQADVKQADLDARLARVESKIGTKGSL